MELAVFQHLAIQKKLIVMHVILYTQSRLHAKVGLGPVLTC